jgi:hypothetical protein
MTPKDLCNQELLSMGRCPTVDQGELAVVPLIDSLVDRTGIARVPRVSADEEGGLGFRSIPTYCELSERRRHNN